MHISGVESTEIRGVGKRLIKWVVQYFDFELRIYNLKWSPNSGVFTRNGLKFAGKVPLFHRNRPLET